MNTTLEKINAMSYTDFIAFVDETNRCPGGMNTIKYIAHNAHIHAQTHLLEVGSNTGFTSLELSRLTHCTSVGIDVSEACVRKANETLERECKRVRQSVSFKVGSAYDIPVENNAVDVVVAGGATTFMDDPHKAIEEYIRVLKPWGFLSVTHLAYHTPPPAELLRKLSEALGVDILPRNESDWKSVFEVNRPQLEVFSHKSCLISQQSQQRIDEYIQYFMTKEHIAKHSTETKLAIEKKWRRYIELFNENHQYLGFFTTLYRKVPFPTEPELFTTNEQD